MDQFVAGTAENVEAEYGYENVNDAAFTLVQLYNDEPVTVEGFSTVEALKVALAEIEDRKSILWLL